MSVFKTLDHNGVLFQRDPSVTQIAGTKGWVIKAHSNDESLYGGQYVRVIGWADEHAGARMIGFRLKRDAKAAMREAVNLGILYNAYP